MTAPGSIFPLRFEHPLLAPLFPAVRARIAALFGDGFDPTRNHGPIFFHRLDALVDEADDVLPDARELAAVGFELLSPANSVEMRRRGCIWLTLFPSLAMVDALARVVRDRDEPEALRDQALWTLGFRQIQARSDALQWDEATVRAADDVLRDAFSDRAMRALPQFGSALRHIADPSLLDAMAREPVEAARYVDAFATETLARALLAHLRAIGSEDAVRVIRLVGVTLGSEAFEPLLAFAKDAPIAERVEALFTAYVIDPHRARAPLDAFVRSLAFADRIVRRRAWHDANPGVFPTVEALRIARTSACLDPAERLAACARAAHLFDGARQADMLIEGYLVDLWRHVAWRARENDPQLFVNAIEAAPGAVGGDGRVRDAYLEALASTGRFARLEEVARAHGGADRAAWLLATHGRPMRALAMRLLAPASAPRAIAAEALALFLAGRPDLAMRALEYADARGEGVVGVALAPPFPGPDERERIARGDRDAPMLQAIADRVLDPLFGCMRSAADGADPDLFDFALLARYADAPNPGDLRGATVYLAGRFADETALRDLLEAAGAQIVSGPFAKTAFYVRGEGADDAAIARLEARGTRPLPRRALK